MDPMSMRILLLPHERQWMMVSSGTGSPGSAGQRTIKRLCVCACVHVCMARAYVCMRACMREI